ncbi:MAG: PaaI family thioesterase [Thermodesulfobacteriota bacterium]
MSDNIRTDIPKLQGHTCFACGTANPIGLNLEFYRLGDAVCSDVVLGKYYEGWENMAHGGIISTLLDEVMSWTILYFRRIFFVTRKMEVKYVKPVLVGIPLRVKARLVNEKREGLIAVQAEIRDERGKVLCKAAGEFVELPAQKLSVVPDGLKRDMEELFRRFERVIGEPEGTG